jgi:hypothetical protein
LPLSLISSTCLSESKETTHNELDIYFNNFTVLKLELESNNAIILKFYIDQKIDKLTAISENDIISDMVCLFLLIFTFSSFNDSRNLRQSIRVIICYQKYSDTLQKTANGK